MIPRLPLLIPMACARTDDAPMVFPHETGLFLTWGTFEGATCNDPEPEVVCPPTHLGEASTRGGSPCASHDDCDWDEFCGSGQCRRTKHESVTVCIEAAWFRGDPEVPTDGPPVLGASMGGTYDFTGTGYAISYTTFEFETPFVASCTPTWRTCRVGPYEGVLGASLDVDEQGGHTVGWGWIDAASVDGGCTMIPIAETIPAVRAWIAVWYP